MSSGAGLADRGGRDPLLQPLGLALLCELDREPPLESLFLLIDLSRGRPRPPSFPFPEDLLLRLPPLEDLLLLPLCRPGDADPDLFCGGLTALKSPSETFL